MVSNPIKQLKEKADLLGTQIGAITATSSNQTKIMQENIKLMEKQCIFMERWANAADAQAEILQEISETLKNWKETR